MEVITDVDLDTAVALAGSNDVRIGEDILSSELHENLHLKYVLGSESSSGQVFDQKQRKDNLYKKQPIMRGKKDYSHARDSTNDRGEPKKVRKETCKVGSHPGEEACTVNDDVKWSATFRIMDLDRFRHDTTKPMNSPVSGDASIVMRSDMEPQGFTTRGNSSMEVGSRLQGVDGTADCDDVAGVGDESQFTVLLNLCGEEFLEDVSGTGDVPSVPCVSNSIESLEKLKSLPSPIELKESAFIFEGNSLSGSPAGLGEQNGVVPVLSSTNRNSSTVIQLVGGIGEQSPNDDVWEGDTDDISSMMTQQCLVQLDQVESPRKSSLPVHNFSYSPRGLDSNQTGLSAIQPECGTKEQSWEDELCKDTTENVSLIMTQCTRQLGHFDSPKSPFPLQDANFSPSRLDTSETYSPFIQPENCSLPLQDICYIDHRIDMDETDLNFSRPENILLPLQNISVSPNRVEVDQTDGPCIRTETGGEEPMWHGQPREDYTDDISCMMTQQCLPQLRVRRRSLSLPLQDITNLVDTRTQHVKVKPLSQAADRMGSDCIDSNSAPGQEKTPTADTPGSPCRLSGVVQLEINTDLLQLPVESEDHQYRDAFVGDSILHNEGTEETVLCPVCGDDISEVSVEERLTHTNSCLDKLDSAEERRKEEGVGNSPSVLVDLDRVKVWLESLNLSRYVSLFVEQEIDWDTLEWLTEEDLLLMGISAVGPRRKIISALQELKTGNVGTRKEPTALPQGPSAAVENTTRNPTVDGMSRNPQTNGGESSNLITNYFPLPPDSGRQPPHDRPVTGVVRQNVNAAGHSSVIKNKAWKRPRSSVYRNTSGVPAWMCIPGTSFRVDAFQHLSGDCSHWFLTHFHTDHYQGLTRGFRYGQIYCSLITARLVNLRIGVSWERLMIMPLNEKFKIDGVDVTFIDANHCPGSVMILFEPPNGEAVLHTGDFRFCTEMTKNNLLQSIRIHTLVLDTTYCDPQYDFPSQETVVRFVIEAIQAEAFNSDTLFLIGTYTIGKERLFLEVGKVLKKFVYVSAAKKKLLDCMDLTAEDTQWLTCNSQESFIHVVPLWSISSFKRMNSISRHYNGKFKLIVAFSPSGWSFGRGKKKTPGKRWRQGTMIRYEVPYSEHSSFSELKEFLKFIAPEDIIPSVLAKSGKGAEEMLACLWSEENVPS